MRIEDLRASLFLGLALPMTAVAFAPAAPGAALPPLPRGAPGIELPTPIPAAAARLAALEAAPLLELDADTGALMTLGGALAPAGSGAATDRAESFLVEVLGLPAGDRAPESLVVVRVMDSPGATHVTFQHRLDGVPVRGEEVAVHLGRDGSVHGVTGSFHPAPRSGCEPSLDAATAIGRAGEALGVRAQGAPATAIRLWVPHDGELVPSWEVQVTATDPLGDFVVLVDARDGAILGGEDRLVFARHGPRPRAPGEGNVYPRHPLAGEPQVLPLSHLDPSGDGLKGEFAAVANEDAPAAQAPDLRFDYEPADTHFDEVMVYHHMNRMHDYFAGMGYDRRNHPIPTTVHYGDGYDNAFFSPFRDVMAFGDGSSLNDLAQEDDVIYHEYTHATVQKVVLLFGYEAGGMNEGYADYFAASVTDDPRIGVWVMAKEGKPYLRTLENDTHYPEDMSNEPHQDGQVWAATLWDLRQELGAALTDRLVYSSWYYIGFPPSFRAGLAALMMADLNLAQGAHSEVIERVFDARGIRLADPPARVRRRWWHGRTRPEAR